MMERFITTLVAFICLAMATLCYLGMLAALVLAVVLWDVAPLLGVLIGFFGGSAMLADGLIVLQMRRELTT